MKRSNNIKETTFYKNDSCASADELLSKASHVHHVIRFHDMPIKLIWTQTNRLKPIVKNASLVLALLFLAAGCHKETAGVPQPSTSPNSAASPAGDGAAADETTKTLSRLTQALRKYSAEHQRVPKSLNELVAEGYISEMPAAPPGKAFTFDDKLQVTLANKK